MPTGTTAGGILERLAGLFRGRERPPAAQDDIPPGAPLYGSGPDFVNDSTPAPTTLAGDPWAPVIGRTQPTHQQVADQALRYGDPRPQPSEPTRYWAKRDADDAQRHSVQVIDGDGWSTPTNGTVYNPILASRPPSNRWTSSAHPELDSFIVTDRETDGQARLTGSHFSMADHRRDYPIHAETPATSKRNTWRLEPTAWDQDLVDMPVEEGLGQNEGPTGYEAQASIIGGRGYRLAG